MPIEHQTLADEAATLALGASLGTARLTGGGCVYLEGDLGAGKPRWFAVSCVPWGMRGR